MIEYRLTKTDLSEVAQSCVSEFTLFSGKKIIVTGGSGFIGSWILETLLYAREVELLTEANITVINRATTPLQAKWAEAEQIRIIQSDVRDLNAQSLEADIVFHCATPASATLNRENPSEMKDTIIRGTMGVVDALATRECRFVNLSSGAVYGTQHPEIDALDENMVPDLSTSSLSAYAVGKIHAEDVLDNSSWEGNGSVVHARLFAFLAPLLPTDQHFAAGNFIGSAVGEIPILVKGDPSTTRSYQYGTDLVRSLYSIAARAQPFDRFNVGSGVAVSVGDLAERIARIATQLGLDTQIKYDWDGSAPTRYVPSTTKLERLLDFHQRVSLEVAIERTIRWHVDKQSS